MAVETECGGSTYYKTLVRSGYAPVNGLIRICLLGLFVQIAVSASAAAQSTQAAGSQQPLLMDRQKEIALALSACPPSVASKAVVYVLDKSGYVKVRDSQNGFTAIVQHSLPTSQEPQCMDAEGTRTFLPRILKVAELRAQGKSPEEIKRFVADAFAKGVFRPPSRLGIDYMLSTENVVPIDEDKGIVAPFPPHVMFYGPYLTNADLGSDGNPGGPAFVVNEGTPHALIIVPVATHTGPGGASASTTTVQSLRQEERIQMPVHQDSPAVAIARAHVEEWSNHDWDKARRSLAARRPHHGDDHSTHHGCHESHRHR